ncbi:MAG: hypothetical protein MJK12_05065 [Colwellia sp.]|nr:hypothetical protein [Colwellia sp.]
MRPLPLWLILPITLLFISINSYGKNICEKQLNKLHKIQIKQRQGHSLKRSNTLNAQEHKARKQWWECTTSPSKTTKKRTKSKSKKKTTQSAVNVYKVKAKVPSFKSSGAIIVKEKYKGKKNFAWLNYYQQPEACKRPKKLSVFARCTEDRQAQQLKFEQTY